MILVNVLTSEVCIGQFIADARYMFDLALANENMYSFHGNSYFLYDLRFEIHEIRYEDNPIWFDQWDIAWSEE